MEAFIKLKEVQKRCSLSKTKIYDMMKKDEFPKNVLISIKCVVWLESEIDAWMQTKISEARSSQKAA